MAENGRLFKDPAEPPRDIWIHDTFRRMAEEGSVWTPPPSTVQDEREPTRARPHRTSAGQRKNVIA